MALCEYGIHDVPLLWLQPAPLFDIIKNMKIISLTWHGVPTGVFYSQLGTIDCSPRLVLIIVELRLCSSDGYLSVYDLRQRKVFARSDNMEEELLSVAIMKVNCVSGCARYRIISL